MRPTLKAGIGIVARHGGTITAYSDGLAKGSRFTIALPLDVAVL